MQARKDFFIVVALNKHRPHPLQAQIAFFRGSRNHANASQLNLKNQSDRNQSMLPANIDKQ